MRPSAACQLAVTTQENATRTYLLNLLACTCTLLLVLPVKVGVGDSKADKSVHALDPREPRTDCAETLRVRRRVAGSRRAAVDAWHEPLLGAREGHQPDLGVKTKGADNLNTGGLANVI